MKKHLYTYFILGALCFSPLPVQAVFCVPKLFRGKKQAPTLSEELNDPELIVQSTISPHMFGAYIGYHPLPYIIREWVYRPTVEEQAKYSFAYIPPSKRKEKGYIALSFKLSLAPDQIYQHWVFWPSDAENAHLDKSTVKALFNRIYEEVYGRDLDWLVENHAISKTLFSLAKQEGFHGVAAASYIDQFKLHEVFNFNSLLFKGNEDELKLIVAEVIQNPGQTQIDSAASAAPSRMHPEMESAIKEITIKEAQGKMTPVTKEDIQLRTLKEITVDMDSLYPEDVVKFLTEGGQARSSREALTPEQVRQIDVSVPDIQYVFAPTFKHFRHVFRDREALTIDTLSDEQIMSFDRDTFLRDVFLAGDLYVQGPMGRFWDVTKFMLARQIRVKKEGHDVVMSGSLPKGVHDFILRKLGFPVDFEDMTPAQRREVFKAEIKMMTDLTQQIKIIEALISVGVNKISTEEAHDFTRKLGFPVESIKEIHDFIRESGFPVDFDESMTPTERREIFMKEIEMMKDQTGK